MYVIAVKSDANAIRSLLSDSDFNNGLSCTTRFDAGGIDYITHNLTYSDHLLTSVSHQYM